MIKLIWGADCGSSCFDGFTCLPLDNSTLAITGALAMSSPRIVVMYDVSEILPSIANVQNRSLAFVLATAAVRETVKLSNVQPPGCS